LLMLVLVSGRG